MFKRLSTSIWSLVSPGKTVDETGKTPKTAPQLQRHASQAQRKGSLEDVVKRTRSMSPIARVASWKVEEAAVSVGQKRKLMQTSGMRIGGRRKARKMEDGDVAWEESEEEDVEQIMEVDEDDGSELYNEEDEDGMLGIESDMDNIHVRSPSRSTTPSSSSLNSNPFEDDLEQDTSIHVSDDPSPRPGGRPKLINLPAEHEARGLSASDLRAEGWDVEHILLVQKLAMRGHEPLLPAYFKMDYPYLPEILFSKTDEAFISSTKASHLRAIKALNALFEIGGRVRDRIICGGQLTPELQAKKSLEAYCAWADSDADFDSCTTIPLLATVAAPTGTDEAAMQSAIHRRMEKLYRKYVQALRSYDVPQIYGIICTHMLLALVAYRPGDPEKEVRVIAAFDLRDKDYDVWNSLALGILICHLRDVKLKIARETGLGVKKTGAGQEMEEDEDL